MLNLSKASHILVTVSFLFSLFPIQAIAAAIEGSVTTETKKSIEEKMSKQMEKYMLFAIQSAKEGITDQHGGPFGACIVKDGKVIATAHNTVLKDHDPTCHAEMNAIRLASRNLKTHDLSDCEIYTTSEPCPMCFGAIHWANIKKIYVGVSKDTAAKFGFRDDMFYEQLLLAPHKRSTPCYVGILESQCEDVFKHWKKLEGKLY